MSRKSDQLFPTGVEKARGGRENYEQDPGFKLGFENNVQQSTGVADLNRKIGQNQRSGDSPDKNAPDPKLIHAINPFWFSLT